MNRAEDFIETLREGRTTRYYLGGREVFAGDLIEAKMTDGQWLTVRFEPDKFGQFGIYQLLLYLESDDPPPEITQDAPCRWPNLRSLRSETGETVELPGPDWEQLLGLARIAGMEVLADADVFSRAEASAMASLLESLLDDIPYNNLRERLSWRENPLEWFSGAKKITVEDLIAFSRRGAFCVRKV